MAQAFRSWVYKKYKGNKQALQNSWNDNNIDFSSIKIPTRTEEEKTDLFCFRDPSLCRKVIDYYIFRAELIASIVIYFCKIAKENDDNQSIVGVSFSYIGDEFSGAFFADEGFTSYKRGAVQNWSHHAFSKILDSSYVDFNYGFLLDFNRQPGGDAQPYSVLETIKMHGKLFITQDDTRTSLSTVTNLGKSETIKESIEIIKRNYCHDLLRGFVTMWGNQGSDTWWPVHNDVEWYMHPDILNTLREIRQISTKAFKTDRTYTGEVAVIIDEDGACYESIDINLRFPLFYLQKVYELGRIGAPYSTYIINDLAHSKMPKYKFYIFFNAFQLSKEEREIIKTKIQRNGNVILWVYAPGLIDDNHISVKNMEDITGIQLAKDDDQWGLNITITDYEHPITLDLPNYMRFGTDLQIGPIIYSNDKDAKELGKLIYHKGMSKTGFCIKKFSEWSSIFIGAPVIPAIILRNIARYAGVHVYSDSLDVLYANNSFLMIHSNYFPGKRNILLKRKTDIYDIFEKRIVAKNVKSFTDNLPPCTTKLYYIGNERIDF